MKKTLLALFAAATLWGCSKDSPGPGDDPGGDSDTDYAVHVLTEQQASKLQSLDPATGKLVFDGTGIDGLFDKGDIICSAPATNAPYGFLYRVKKITVQGGKTVVETKQASLEEAIKDADFSKTIQLDDQITGIFDADGNPIEYTIEPATRATATDVINIPVNLSVQQGPGAITVKGSVRLSTALEFDMKVEDNKLKHMKVACTASLAHSLSVSGELSGNIKLWDDWEFASIKLSPIIVQIGFIPVVLKPEIPICFTGEVGGSVSGEFTLFDSEYSITAGMEYDGTAVKPIVELNSSQDKPLQERVKVALSGWYKMGVEAGPEVLLYGNPDWMVGIPIGLYGKLSINSPDGSVDVVVENVLGADRYGFNPYLAFHIGSDIGLKGALKIFKEGLDYDQSVNLFEKELARSNVFPQFSDVTVNDLKEAVSTAQAQDGGRFNVLFPVSQYGICYGENSLPSIERDWYNNLGAFPETGWTSSNAPVASATLDMDADKTYYVCVYFKNVFGTFYSKVNSVEEGDWIEINGIKWATCNVDAPGTFTKNPQDIGKSYQWNSRIPGNVWAEKDYWEGGSRYSYTWSNNLISWLPENDPCPAGYRVASTADCNASFNDANVVSSSVGQMGSRTCLFIHVKATGKTLVFPMTADDPNAKYPWMYWLGDGTFVNGTCSCWALVHSTGPENAGDGLSSMGGTVTNPVRCVRK